MAKTCQYTGCERGTYGELCIVHKPKKRPTAGKHTIKDRQENKKFRDSKLNYQGYLICELCGSWCGSDADHKVKKSVDPSRRYDPANKQILCRDCHIEKDK